MESGKKKVFRRDNEATNVLIKAGRLSGKEAIRSSKALGLTVSYLEKGWVVKEFADGQKKLVKKHDNSEASAFKVKKGMILHAKK